MHDHFHSQILKYRIPAPQLRPSPHPLYCRWSLQAPNSTAGEWYVNLVTCADVATGEQLYLCYRGGESNDVFCLHYGFVPPHNPHDAALLFGSLAEALRWHYEEYVSKVSMALAWAMFRTLHAARSHACLHASCIMLCTTAFWCRYQ